MEAETHSQRKSVEELERTNATLEQSNHELRQKLQISSMAVKELEGSQVFAGELEKEVDALKDKVRLKEEHVAVFKKVSFGEVEKRGRRKSGRG